MQTKEQFFQRPIFSDRIQSFQRAYFEFYTAMANNPELHPFSKPIDADILDVTYLIIQFQNRLYCEYCLNGKIYNEIKIRRLMKKYLRSR